MNEGTTVKQDGIKSLSGINATFDPCQLHHNPQFLSWRRGQTFGSLSQHDTNSRYLSMEEEHTALQDCD